MNLLFFSLSISLSLPPLLLSMEYVWEQFRWSVGGSCEKDSCNVREKGQVACTPALTVKSHLHEKKVKPSREWSL